MSEPEQLDDLTKESLISQLKEKVTYPNKQIKENKTIQKKLDKLSEKYVQTYKEYKLLVKDRETLFQAISFALNEEQYKFEQKQLGNIYATLGQFDVNQIIDQFKQKEEDRSRALTNLIKETNNEKFLLEERYRQMIEKQGQNSDQKTQQIIKQLRQQLSELDNNNTRLAKEIIELNDIIQIKNTQIQKMSQLEEDYANLKTQCMVSELQFQQPDRQLKISSADQMNEQLKMKQQIDRLLEEIQKQNQKIKQLEQQPLPQKIETPTAGYDYDEINPFEQDNGFRKEDSQTKTISSTIQTQTDFPIPEDNSVTSAANFEYLRNVVYKYFLYQETRNYKEASILMNAIMTILRMSNEERRRIDQARERGFLKSAKNLISDSFMCLKQPQLNDMNLERPNSRVELMNKHMMN